MSEKLSKDSSKVGLCDKNLNNMKTCESEDEDLTTVKSGTFDSEFDLLESTLTGLKQDENESFGVRPMPNSNNLIIEKDLGLEMQPNSRCRTRNAVTTQNEYESFKAKNSVMSIRPNSFQDTSFNLPDCVQKNSLQSTQHFKSSYHQGDVGNNSDIFSHLDRPTNSVKSEITNIGPKEDAKKPILFFDCDQIGHTSDEKKCDNQHSSASLDLRGEELSLATKYPQKGCDFGIEANKCPISLIDKLKDPYLKSFTNSGNKPFVSSVEFSSEATTTMDDTTTASVSCHPEGSQNYLSKMENTGENSLKTDPAIFQPESPQRVRNDENEHEENSTMENPVKNSLNTDPEITHPENPLPVSNNENEHEFKSAMENQIENSLNTDLEISHPVKDPQPLCDDKNKYEEKQTETNDYKLFNVLDCNEVTPKKGDCQIVTRSDLQVDEDFNHQSTKKQGIISSTPNVTRKSQEDTINDSGNVPDFGLVSPLDVKCSKGKQNLKRKCIGLQPIEEIDENTDATTTKKIKVEEEKVTGVQSVAPSEASTSSTMPCFEAPAKSLLKKWQPSCLSRNMSASSFIVLDECGETEFEDCPKTGQEHESPKVDDFEIACQSLTEELMKSSSNIETLEKYHSQVQLENQMDDEKFDEILRELTMNVDLDDQTLLSLRSMDESTITDQDKTCLILKDMEESAGNLQSESEKKENIDDECSLTENNVTVIERNEDAPIRDGLKIEPTNKESVSGTQEGTEDNTASDLKATTEEPSPLIDDDILDEEDYLLEENVNTKDKPYEFFEFVSSDPKENEDNYNPEWQKLGQLTSDEERYKAVRDRWRSLVPPDPNRNLTYRQWRARNNKSPIKLAPLNNNHQMLDDNERNQLCTAVFDNKIKKIVQELEDSRMNIYRQRNREFEELGHAQDSEQIRASMSGFNYQEMAQLHARHLNQCRAVKNQYDQELKRIQDVTEDKIRILREASEEVLLFQKFYKGVGATDDTDLYMTDIQVQELMETEEMLEQYKVFYK